MSFIRSRFRELVDHLKKNGAVYGVAKENFQDEIASMKIVPGGANITEQGWHFANFKYRGDLLIERVDESTAVLLSLIMQAWLSDFDEVRITFKLPPPEIGIMALDSSGLVDMICAIEFVDPVYLSEADDGQISWMGRNFAPIDYDLLIAEKVEVNKAKGD